MLVGIIMGSDSDYEVMADAAKVMRDLDIAHEIQIVSAHRTPDKMIEYARSAKDRGIKVIIAGAGGSAHLPGMVASLTCLPVIGVPVKTQSMGGLDSLLSIVQMPTGVPVATVPVNGSTTAGILAAKILAIDNNHLRDRIESYMKQPANQCGVENWLESPILQSTIAEAKKEGKP